MALTGAVAVRAVASAVDDQSTTIWNDSLDLLRDALEPSCSTRRGPTAWR